MDVSKVGQEAWDAIRTLTTPESRDELAKLVSESGLKLSGDNATVVSVTGGVDALTRLAEKLKSAMPVARIGLKRVLARHEVFI